MKRPTRRLSPLFPTLALVALASGTYLQGFVSFGHTWSTDTVRYYVNPHSVHVSEQAAVSAIQTAATGWNEQSRANIRLVYAGTTSASSLAMNHKNEVFFRNEAKGSTVGEAWYWWDGSGRLVDADIVLYEGGYPLFAFSGCAYGVYIENVAIHEFGTPSASGTRTNQA